MQAADKLPDKLSSFASIVEKLQNPDYLKLGGEPAQQLLGSLPDMLEDDYSVELRFVSGRQIGGNERLEAIVEAANTGFDESHQKITLELYGSAELIQLDKEFAAAATGAPVGTVTFSIQEKKLLRWEISGSDAPRDTLVGVIKGNELSALYGEYGNKLFASNIRLPLITKKVNPEIRKTADETPEDFFYYNNGVSAVCKRYEINGTTVTAHGFQIINGAQTVDALRKALKKKPDSDVYVLFRLTASESYGADKHFTENVIRYNNTQNPVKTSDFFSNDPIQIWLSKNLSKLSGKAPMPAFYYVHKSGYRPSNTQGRKQLKIDTFAGLRHAFLKGPVQSFRDPAAFFDRNGLYNEAFGVDDKIEDSWDSEILAQAACAIAINDKVQRIAREVQAKERELRKQGKDVDFPEARYLYRLSRYVTALVAVGLKAIIPSKINDFATLMASKATFDRYVDPLMTRARDLVENEMVERLQRGDVQPEYNFARDDKAWTKLETRMESAALTKIEFSTGG